MRKLAALPIYWLCWALDQLPWRDSIDKRWYIPYGLGCYLGVSRIAARVEGDCG